MGPSKFVSFKQFIGIEILKQMIHTHIRTHKIAHNSNLNTSIDYFIICTQN